MIRKRKPLVNFARYSDAKIIPPAEFIIESMQANPAFASPLPKILDVATVLNSYKLALTEASSRDRTKVALKNQLRMQLNDLLKQLGVYVDNVANGDVTTIVLSGYAVSKDPEPRYITAPTAPVLKPGNNPGTIACKIKKVKYANSYVYMLADTQTKDAVWTSITSTRTALTFSNLEPGKLYTIKVAAIGSNAQLEYSIPVNQYAL